MKNNLPSINVLMALTSLVFAALALPSQAQVITPITLSNPSFESPSVQSTGCAT